jgi:hypothetical protein
LHSSDDQRVTERRETYHVTELDEATWCRLRVGRRCRLKIGALGDEVKEVTPRG